MQEEKARAELARKPEPAARPQPVATKPRDEPAAKRSLKSEPAAPTKSASPTAPSATSTGQSTPPALAPPATLAPEAAKPVKQTSAELIADADNAIKAQHYTDAIAILKPLGDTGNVQAQTRLGDAYVEGRGVDRDLAVGERWYEKAALQGDTSAQIKLGAMFAKGQGVAQSNNLAYVWYGTAARLGSASAKTERDKIAALLQPAEREQLDKLIASKVDGMKKQ